MNHFCATITFLWLSPARTKGVTLALLEKLRSWHSKPGVHTGPHTRGSYSGGNLERNKLDFLSLLLPQVLMLFWLEVAANPALSLHHNIFLCMELIPFTRLPCDPHCRLITCSSSFCIDGVHRPITCGKLKQVVKSKYKGRVREERTLLPRATQKEEWEMADVPQDLLLRGWKEPQLRRLWTVLINREHQAQLTRHRPHKVFVPAGSWYL